jgi:caa(3)-type oxidase subunit IV
MSHAAEHAYDPIDPHGFHAHDHGHGHVVVPWQTLLLVLLTLLVFTGLTIFQAQAEKFAAYEWGWQFPHWVNIVLAMSIAVVKGALVVLFFMQLRYDNGLNAILFLFTLFAVWLFLMFTMIDLSGRSSITPWRGGEVVAGGTSAGLRDPKYAGGSGAIVQKARQDYIAVHGQAAYDEHMAEHAHHGAYAPAASTKDHARPTHGLTPGLFDTGVWAELESEHGADEAPAPH